MLARGRQLMEHVLPAVIKPLRVLWNQVIGFAFAVFAIIAAPRAVRSVREFDGDAQSLFEVLLTAVFVLTMAVFAVQSFWRARKASK
jgi:hypothetical protein